SNLAQIQRSWYMFFFQHGLSNHVVAANDLAFIDMLWSQWSPGFDAREDLEHVKAALRTPEHLTAALGYYRATLGDGARDPELAALQQRMGGEYPSQPLLYLHGDNDGCVGREVAAAAQAMSPAHIRYEFVANAGHFMQLELQQALLAKINSSVSNSRRGAPYDLKDLSLGKIPESLTLAAFNGLFENLDVDGMFRAAALLVAKARGTPFDVDILAIPNKFESSNPTFWTTLKKQAESFIEVM
ncbi:MAG: alpha/beta hydrolase, partial [Actinobacteria bacterium]|nr:alpha/beta hydrolase [Actinomycetota bacterium]